MNNKKWQKQIDLGQVDFWTICSTGQHKPETDTWMLTTTKVDIYFLNSLHTKDITSSCPWAIYKLLKVS